MVKVLENILKRIENFLQEYYNQVAILWSIIQVTFKINPAFPIGSIMLFIMSLNSWPATAWYTACL